jgi:hypothetical protein
MRNKAFHGLLIMAVVALTNGCASVQRITPAAPGQVNIKLKDSDYTVTASVKGSSITKSYACGLVKVIDDNKVRVLGIKLFKDQFCYLTPKNQLSSGEKFILMYPGFWIFLPFTASYIAYHHSASAEDRAFYKVVAAAPDADAIIKPSLTAQRSGIPLIYGEEEVTVTGKAIKYKSE